MSWTNETTESNYFKVKETEEVTEVLEDMGFVVDRCSKDDTISFYSTGEGTYFDEYTEVVTSLKPYEKDGELRNYLGILSDYSPNTKEDLLEQAGLEEKDVLFINIKEYLTDMLETGYAIVITTAGFESRSSGDSSPFGDVLFLARTENEIIEEGVSLWGFARTLAEKHKVKI